MSFGDKYEALQFVEAGGQVSMAEWAALADSERDFLRAAQIVLDKRRAVFLAEALQGRLTEAQRYESDMQELARVAREVADA